MPEHVAAVADDLNSRKSRSAFPVEAEAPNDQDGVDVIAAVTEAAEVDVTVENGDGATVCVLVGVFFAEREDDSDGMNDDDNVTGACVAAGVAAMVATGVGGDAGATAPPLLRDVYGYTARVAGPIISSNSRFAYCSTISDEELRLTVRPIVVCFLFSVYVMEAAARPCTSNRLLD